MMKSVLFWKITTLLGLMVVMLIPIAQLMSVIDERSGYRQSVVGQVSESTSGAQRVLGPLIVIPYVEREEKKDEKGQTVVQRVQHHRYLLPESLQVQGRRMWKCASWAFIRRRFTRAAELQRCVSASRSWRICNANVTVGQPFLLVALSDSRGIKSISPLATPQPVAFEPGTGVGSLRQGIHAPLTLAALQQKRG